MQSISNKSKTNTYSQVQKFPKRILLGINDGQCNMKCPFCYVHGNGSMDIKQLRGDMPYDLACKIFDEVQGTGLFISPVLWSEPLLIQNLENYVSYMSGKGLNVFINSNGILLTEEKVTALFSAKVHTIFISIDAITNETLKAIRGVKKLQDIHDSVFRLLKMRGDNKTPRIGVSFNESEVNMHEKDKFIPFG
ncbi:MAG: Molybdopterin cofactor synthesis protein A [Candidatus Magnetoglobus multicellularis str. Araruama]|uniref:Molybdopterin cofactor synthesis protein A n=1 Tax=Candidatus Magnetoglobus multicellularis str. Araruama TaxID=890399 RepID=A0A1V1NVB4_9BACT|nr:MAG: Molybdopterin cofactor synthesis protein A [Candidatus Magnetoglobus multicellularis str. Araruama]